MAFLYPWGNTQQLNLDWILQKIKELEAGGGGGGGGSADLDEVANALISASYAVQAYDRSDIVFRDGKLYRANQAIPAPGEAWTPAHWDEILLGDTVSNLVQYVAALSNDQIVNNSNVSGTHTSDALNTLNTAIGDISNLPAGSTDLVDAVNDLNGAIGDISNLPSGSTDLADAVNDLNGAIGDISNLPSGSTDLVDAVNDLNGAIKSGYPKLDGKRIIIYGDSISYESFTPSGFTAQPNWVTYLRNHCTATIDNRSIEGKSITGEAGLAVLLNNSDDLDADIIILFAGVNDYRNSRQLGDYSSTENYVTLWGALKMIHTKLNTSAPTAKVFFVSPLKEYAYESYPTGHNNYRVISMYRKVMKICANWWGYNYIDGYSAPLIQPLYTTQFQPDKLHPNTAYAPILCNYIASKIENDDSMEIGDETNLIQLNAYADSGLVSVSSLNAYFQQDTGEMTIQGAVSYTNNTAASRYNIATGLPDQFKPRFYITSPAYGSLTGEGIPGSIIYNTSGELYLSLYSKPTTTNNGTIIFQITFNPTFVQAVTDQSI